MEKYNENIDYKDLLTRFIKYRFKTWISAPRNRRRYPWLVGRDICFEYEIHQVNLGFGMITNELCIVGDVFCIAGGAKIDNDSNNMAFYSLFRRVFDYGFILQAECGNSESNRVIYNMYKGTVEHLMHLLDSVS